MAQLRAISSRIKAQGLSALQGGCVAGDTEMQRRTRTCAARLPISAWQERGAAAAAAQPASNAAQPATALRMGAIFGIAIEIALTSAARARHEHADRQQ
jgi:hypothetical protein